MPYCGNTLDWALPAPPARGKVPFLRPLAVVDSRGIKGRGYCGRSQQPVTGGSILGDKTRMNDLARAERRLFARYHPPVIWAVPVSERGINAVMRSSGL